MWFTFWSANCHGARSHLLDIDNALERALDLFARLAHLERLEALHAFCNLSTVVAVLTRTTVELRACFDDDRVARYGRVLDTPENRKAQPPGVAGRTRRGAALFTTARLELALVARAQRKIYTHLAFAERLRRMQS